MSEYAAELKHKFKSLRTAIETLQGFLEKITQFHEKYRVSFSESLNDLILKVIDILMKKLTGELRVKSNDELLAKIGEAMTKFEQVENSAKDIMNLWNEHYAVDRFENFVKSYIAKNERPVKMDGAMKLIHDDMSREINGLFEMLGEEFLAIIKSVIKLSAFESYDLQQREHKITVKTKTKVSWKTDK